MRKHRRKPADEDVALTLVSGLTGIHPGNIRGYVLIADNRECGIHLTTTVCCAYHALAWLVREGEAELPTLVPCSDDGH